MYKFAPTKSKTKKSMKKHYSIIASLLAVMVFFSYTSVAQKFQVKPVIQNKADLSSQNPQFAKINHALLKNNATRSIDSNNVFMSQDFSSATFPPTGWTRYIVGGTATLNWTRGTSLTLSYNTLNPTGTTFSNGYAWVDSDGYGSGNPAENCALQSPSINCSSYTNVFLSFSEFFREYAASTAIVEVSNNGSTWTQVYEALPGVSVDSSGPNPNFVDINVTTYAAGQATFYVRFHWQGNWDYYWVVDDIKLYSKPAYDIALSAFSNPNEYVVKPIAHYTSGPLTLAATAENMGANTVTNVSMDVNVLNLSTQQIVHSATSNTIASLAPGATGLLTASTSYTPPADTGIYYIRYIVHMTQTDADLSNDTLYSGFWISDSLFARSDEMYTGFLSGSLGFGTGTYGLMGNDYTLSVADKLNHIDAYVTGPAINDTTQMFVYATGANGIPTTLLGSTAIYKFTAADGQWVSLPIQGGPLSLAAGTYYVALKEFTATNNIGLAYTDNNYTHQKVWIQIGTGTFDTLEYYGFQGSFIIEPYLVCASFMTNATATMDTICSGLPTNLTAINGLTYSWNTGQTTASINVSPTTTTTYTVTATNQYGCTDTDNITIVVNTVNATANANPSSICTGDYTQITATGGGTYAWSPATGLSATNIANPIATPTTTTTYTVTVTNNGCTATASATVTVNSIPIANAGSNVSICSGSSTTLNASGGTTYAWSPASGLSATNISNPTANPTATTTYVVTVSNGTCSATDDVLVTVYPVPTANAGTDQSIPTGTSTTLSGSATGGTPAFNYLWSPAGSLVTANVQNPTTTNLTVTTVYTLTVTDLNGCTSTDQVTVTVTGGVLSVNCPAATTICSGSCITLIPLVSGGSAPYSYMWSMFPTDTSLAGHDTEAAPTVCPLVTTTYTIDVTDNASGTVSCSVVITVDPLMSSDTASTPEICGNNDGTATVTVTGGTPPINYIWSNAQTTQTATGLAAGTYYVTVTDAEGCSIVDTVIVNCVVGIHETAASANISVAPNPSDGTFNMTITGYEGKDATLSICNMKGQILYTENLSVKSDIYSEKMNLQDLGQGIYLLKVRTQNSVKIARLIIE